MSRYREIARTIANGDWFQPKPEYGLGKLDFVRLEELIHQALLEAVSHPDQTAPSCVCQTPWANLYKPNSSGTASAHTRNHVGDQA